MQRAIYQQATPVTAHSSCLPGHGTGVEENAANDDSFEGDPSLVKFVMSVLINVIGGALLLSAMYFMPHVIARVFM